MEEKQKEKQLSTNRLILPLLFVFCSIILEIANFLYLGIRNSNGARMAFPTYFLFDIAIILMLAAFIFVLQNKYAICVAFCLILAVQAGVAIVNTTLYGLFGEVLSFSLMKLGAEARSAFSFDLIDWGGVALNLCLYVAMLVSAILLTKFNKKTYSLKHFAAPVLAVAVFILIEAFGTCLYEIQIGTLNTSEAQESEIQSSDVYLWENFQFKMEAYKKFGFYGFYSKEIINSVVSDKLDEKEKIDYIKYIDEGYVAGNKNAPLYGDNLIVVLLESADLWGIDPIYTPTLYKMYNGYHSFAFQNFYARNRTNNSEGITLLGSMPKNSSIKDAYNQGYEFDYSLPHLFKRGGDENVVTSYIHPNRKTFYDRHLTHTLNGMGFDNMLTIEDYTGDQYIAKWGNWLQDIEFSSNLMDKIMPKDKRFLISFSTMSTHGPYTFERQYFEEEYETYDAHVEEYKVWLEENGYVYPEDEYTQSLVRNFKIGTIDLDNTIANFISELEKRGLSENTSMLLYTDHNSYYNDLCYTMRGIDKSDFSSTEVNHIAAMIYSPKLLDENGQIIDTFCSTYDLLPTICDLYGLESNQNIFLGYSVFSKDIKNTFFASHLGGMFTDKIYSQNINDLYIRGEVTEDDITRFRENAVNHYKKQAIMEIIYKNGINGTKISYPRV